MHHHHLHGAEPQPGAIALRSQHQLDDFAGVEVPPHEFPVGFVFFEGGDGEVVGFHDRVADCGDALEEVLGVGGGGAGEGFDEGDLRGGLWGGGVEAEDVEGHGWVGLEQDGDGDCWGEAWKGRGCGNDRVSFVEIIKMTTESGGKREVT